MSGQWLAPAAAEHRCRTPFLLPFRVRIGDRWKCTRRLHDSEVCGKIWRVIQDSDGRMWTEENPDTPDDWKVFRAASEEQVNYWLKQELGPLDQPIGAAKVVAAIMKHFEVGSRR
jgi:hypothetical protein